MRLILFQPDIPQNAGTLLRLAACLQIGVDIIEPLGFIWGNAQLRRAGMDYLQDVDVTRHVSWDTFIDQREKKGRLILLTTKASQNYTEISYQETDNLLLGSETAGVPEVIHRTADIRIKIPIASKTRSLNVAIAGAMVLGEALRQISGFPSI